MNPITPELLKEALAKLNYHWHDSEPNIVGIRTTEQKPNEFNDRLICCWRQPAMPANLSTLEQQKFLNTWLYRDRDNNLLTEDGLPGAKTNFALSQLEATKGKERLKSWVITTLPGTTRLKDIEKVSSVLVPNQYKGAYKLGFHKAEKYGESHPALVQSGGEVHTYRDDNHNDHADETPHTAKGWFGINIHRSNLEGDTPLINDWSAGCQVFRRKSDHDELLSICKGFQANAGTCFTYTLLREKQLA